MVLVDGLTEALAFFSLSSNECSNWWSREAHDLRRLVLGISDLLQLYVRYFLMIHYGWIVGRHEARQFGEV